MNSGGIIKRMSSKNKKDRIDELLEERQKWKHFFEILSRKYVYIPSLLIIVYLIDNPKVNIIHMIKGLLGISCK